MDNPHTFKTPSGDEMVILTRADYDALVEAAAEADEDVELAAIYAERKAGLAAGKDDVLPAEVSALITKGDSRFKAIRKWRKKNQAELAEAMGIAQSYLSLIENGERPMTMDIAAKLSRLLDVPYGWLEP